MAGIVNENIVYPVLDLVRREINKNNNSNNIEVDPFEGHPSVKLYRDNPFDEDRVTGAEMYYESGYIVDLYLKFGSDNVNTYPDGVTPDDFEWDYYKNWRLTEVTSSVIEPSGATIVTYHTMLVYDKKGRLTETIVSRI